MGLSTRDMLLIIRARDEASRVLRGLSRTMSQMDAQAMRAAQAQYARGQAMTSIGVGIASVGAAGLAFFASSAKAAMDYNQQAAKTLTQVDELGVSLEDIKKIGREVAGAIPAPFEEMQSSLYDIFSSMEVNSKGAKKLLTEFSRAAVAGQVDLQAAARGTIGILNAYGLGAKDVNHINDVMFQLVRKGVGTYEEFASAIGKATPSAVRAGQSIEQLSGMMAFLTRNGLTTSMAASSAGRALDAIAKPIVASRLKVMGIAVRDAAGEFRPMSAIIEDMGKKMGDLSKPARAAALEKLFKGAGGTIQARRFFDTAIPGFKSLNQLTGYMVDSSGALQDAYNIMLKQPQTQIQMLKNQWMILRTEIGDMFLPAINNVVQAVIKMVKWFNDLSPHTKRLIVQIMLITSVIMVLSGIVVTVAGFILMMSAAMTMAGVTFAAVAVPVAIAIAAIAALVVVVFLVIKYWDQIKTFTISTWETIKNWIVTKCQEIAAWVMSIWNGQIVQTIITVMQTIWTVIKNVWSTIVPLVASYLQMLVSIIKLWLAVAKTAFTIAWEVIKTALMVVWYAILAVALVVWKDIKFAVIDPIRALWGVVGPIIKAFAGYIKRHWDDIKNFTQSVWSKFKGYIVDPMKAAFDGVSEFVGKIVDKISWLKDKAESIGSGIRGALKQLNPLEHFSPSLVEQAQAGYDALTKTIIGALDNIYAQSTSKSKAIRKALAINVANPPKMPSTKGMTDKQAAEAKKKYQAALLAYKKSRGKSRQSSSSSAADIARIGSAAKSARDAVVNAQGGTIEAGLNAIAAAKQKLADAYKGIKMSSAAKQVNAQLDAMTRLLLNKRSAIYNAAATMAAGITLGIKDSMSPMAAQAASAADALSDAFKGMTTIPANVQAVIDDLKNKATEIQNFRDDIVKKMTSSTSLVALFAGGTETGSVVSGSKMVTKMSKILGDTKLWAAGIRELAKRGLNRDTLKELIVAGPSSLPVIRGLLQGNTITDINKLVSDTWTIANDIANQMEQTAFGVNPAVGGGASASDLAKLMGGSGGGTVFNQDITVNTQEIDPRKNAQDLGFELVGKMGG